MAVMVGLSRNGLSTSGISLYKEGGVITLALLSWHVS